jgi:hypothetical protein
MADKFTRAQIRSEVAAIRDGQLSVTDSPVYEAWADMAADWLARDSDDYLLDGFIGWNGRSADEIVADFHFSECLIDPLTDEELDNIFGKSTLRG